MKHLLALSLLSLLGCSGVKTINDKEQTFTEYVILNKNYEKTQNVPEGVMTLNVVQPPTIPKEIEEYAKEYNLL